MEMSKEGKVNRGRERAREKRGNEIREKREEKKETR